MTDLTIRPACFGDADAVFALLTQFVTSYPPRRAAFDHHYPGLVISGRTVFHVAVLDSLVVGYVLGAVMPTLYANGPVLELQELMVAPEQRGHSIGRRLVETIHGRAVEAGCAEVTVATRRARDFYLALGFEETATYLKRKIAP